VLNLLTGPHSRDAIFLQLNVGVPRVPACLPTQVLWPVKHMLYNCYLSLIYNHVFFVKHYQIISFEREGRKKKKRKKKKVKRVVKNLVPLI